MFQFRTDIPSHLALTIPWICTFVGEEFQFRTDIPSHLALYKEQYMQQPFDRFNSERTSPAI